MAKQSYSLYELNEYIRRVVALNFSELIWINCEISQINNVRGNYYLDLVEQSENGEIKAQISAAIWYKSFLFIKNKLGPLTDSLLSAGTHVQLKVKVDFNERYGLKLYIEDIDPSYTIGQLELKRQQILERLKADGVLNFNDELPKKRIFQRIAVISSATAAGYQDFVNQCQNNAYGYKFKINLYQAAMQGANTESEVVAALRSIAEVSQQYDAIAIIRGGGSKLDLSHFDNFNIGIAIAKSPLPVIVGIGHDIDSSVADIVAAYSLKTPTAVADMLVEKCLVFEGQINETLTMIEKIATRNIVERRMQLQDLYQYVRVSPQQTITLQKSKLAQIYDTINYSYKSRLKVEKNTIKNIMDIMISFDPATILSKGYALIKNNGAIVSSSHEVPENSFDIVFADGSVKVKKT